MAHQLPKHPIYQSIDHLFFHRNPETRQQGAARLGEGAPPLSVEREVLEALTTALDDPCIAVKEAALQSLVRLSIR
ncbi:MAG: hypothetical protein D6690_16180 [Nitrospirae bacterium]|nr:MAG: hypothetical protein D6690_16180 [Nitrospirota bacterium]